jgi:hypothetical protein
MNTGAAGVERAEQIKWWDALDALAEECVEEGLQMTRKCLHPDAQWLASLFPAGVAVARERMREMMLELRNDRRALYVAWLLGEGDADEEKGRQLTGEAGRRKRSLLLAR